MEPFVGEIRLFAFGKIPPGWFPCDGRVLQISQHSALYALLGPTYGGNGQTNFAIPDLRGRVAVHPGNAVRLGEKGGEEGHVLTVNEMPAHNHPALATTSAGDNASPADANWAEMQGINLYSEASSSLEQFSSAAIGSTGSNQPHNNMQPYLTVQYCIAYQGIFPSRK